MNRSIFQSELLQEIRREPGLRTYDYAIRLNARGVTATVARINRELREEFFRKMIRSGMVATHDEPTMCQPDWFVALKPRDQRRVPRLPFVDYDAGVAADDEQTTVLLSIVSSRSLSAFSHHRRILATRSIAQLLP